MKPFNLISRQRRPGLSCTDYCSAHVLSPEGRRDAMLKVCDNFHRAPAVFSLISFFKLSFHVSEFQVGARQHQLMSPDSVGSNSASLASLPVFRQTYHSLPAILIATSPVCCGITRCESGSYSAGFSLFELDCCCYVCLNLKHVDVFERGDNWSGSRCS